MPPVMRTVLLFIQIDELCVFAWFSPIDSKRTGSLSKRNEAIPMSFRVRDRNQVIQRMNLIIGRAKRRKKVKNRVI